MFANAFRFADAPWFVDGGKSFGNAGASEKNTFQMMAANSLHYVWMEFVSAKWRSSVAVECTACGFRVKWFYEKITRNFTINKTL